MNTKISSLGGLDPASAPLVHGAEVLTRVDRVHGGRVIAGGTAGRVVGVSGEAVTVAVVGVGELIYERCQLVLRRAGQARFAARRADAEEALRPCVVLEAIVGSRAWGLASEGSDTDRKGVFVWPFEWTTGLAEAADVVVSPDGSDTYWEIERTIKQLLRADPNTLETLFVSDVRIVDPLGQLLFDAREAFVSRRIYGSFGRYALSQAKKLEQSQRLADHRELLISWLKDEDLTLDQSAIKLAKSIFDVANEDALHRSRQYIKQLYRSMFDQGLLDANDFASLREFAQTRTAEFDLPRQLRPKNAYNLLRLIACAAGWLRTGRPQMVVQGDLRERLLAIKNQQVPLAQTLAWTKAMAAELEEAHASSPLPEQPDVARAEAVLRAVRAEAARRWFEGAPGPWGADRPAPPEVSR